MQDEYSLLCKIESRVLAVGTCRVWQGARNSDGYGNVIAPKWFVEKTGCRWWKVHRLAFYLRHGFLPPEVLHSCDNPPCVEDDHLYAGTHTLNMQDAARKKRMIRGERHPKSLLTQEKANYIRSFYKDGKAPYGMRKRLAQELGVSYWTIDQVLRYTTWMD